MDPGEVPAELSRLSLVEQMLIALGHSMVTCYKLKGNQNGYSGQVISFPQTLQSFATSLPHTIETISRYIWIRKKHASGYRDFLVNQDRVRSAIVWLKNNNIWYHHIEIDEVSLSQLPERSESILNQIISSQRASGRISLPNAEQSSDSSSND